MNWPTTNLAFVGNIKKKRKPRKVTWFNPPWSLNVGTNVAQEFLALLDKHFPPSHKLHSLMNRSNIKVSYRCLPNMGSVVSKHNNKVMKNSAKQTDRKEAECNCKPTFKNSCPMPGKCNKDGVVYQTTITSDGGKKNNYVGLAKNFKKRWGTHKKTLGDPDYNVKLLLG